MWKRAGFAMAVLAVTATGAETLANKLASGDKKKLKETIVIDKTDGRSAQQKRVDDLTGRPRPVDGINVKVAEVNLSKKTTLDFQYAPPLKEGKTIDNEEKATVNVNIKF